MPPVVVAALPAVDITDRPARQLGYVTTDALKAADLNIQAVTRDLQVDVVNTPNVDVTDRPARQLGVITGAVTTDALKASDLNIHTSEKALNIAIIDAVIRLLLNTNLAKLQVDPQGRMLVRIDVAGTSTPVTTATHAVTVASGGIASGAVAAGGIALGALATGAITDLPYRGWDHEGYLSQIAFNGIRDRMEFTV